MAAALEEDDSLQAAVEYDLIQVGLRLRWLCDGTDRLNWRDLLVVLRQSGRDTAIARYELGEAWFWSMDTYLLAGVYDLLASANWQRGGGKGQKPRPIARPGEHTASQVETTTTQGALIDGFEPESLAPAEVDSWLEATFFNDPDPVLAGDSDVSVREQAVAAYNAGGVSQAEVAKAFGVSQSTISRWVNHPDP